MITTVASLPRDELQGNHDKNQQDYAKARSLPKRRSQRQNHRSQNRAADQAGQRDPRNQRGKALVLPPPPQNDPAADMCQDHPDNRGDEEDQQGALAIIRHPFDLRF